MMAWIGSIISKVFMVMGALLLSQMPLYMQYYTQQLDGRVSELQWQIEAIGQMATQSGKDLDQYIGKFLTSDDPDFKLQGRFMSETRERWNDFSNNLKALKQSTVWTRPFIFIRNVNLTIAQATLASFQPGLTLNIEGAVYIVVGMVLGSVIFYLLRQLLRILFSPLARVLRKDKRPA